MTTFWGMSITRKILGVSGLLSALLGLNACQTTSTVNTGDSKDVSFTANLSPDRIPDSISWSFNGKSGRGSIVLLDASKLSYRFDFTLSEPPGSKPYDVTFWRLSIQLARLQVANGTYEQPTWRDTLGLVLLKRLDSLRATKDSASYPESVKSLVEIYATALIDGDTLFKGFPTRTVTTLDTAAIYRAAIIQAAKRRQPYSILAASWGLGLDSLATYNRLAKLVSANGPITPADSLAFFPPYPVRVGKALSVASLIVGGESVPVNGSFVGDSGLSSYKVRILKGTDDKSDLFNITTQPAQLDGSQTAWDLATNARLTLQVKTAEVGSYMLEVSITDPKGRSETSRTEFSVLPPPDKTGPIIEWVSPKSNTLLEHNDSILVIELKLSDESGIDSVLVLNRKVAQKGSTWIDSIVIPVSPLGYDVEARAWDLRGNESKSIVRVIRKESPRLSMPSIRLVEPVNRTGNVLVFDSSIFRTKWVISHLSGIDTASVKATNAKIVSHSDSIWILEADVPPSNSLYTVFLYAKSKDGGAQTEYAEVVRQSDAALPVITRLNHDSERIVGSDTEAVFIEYRVVDNHKLKSVTINDSVIKGDGVVFGALISLSIGANPVTIKAIDSTGNARVVKSSVTRLADTSKPIITRDPSTASKSVLWKDSLTLVKWSVKDNSSSLQVAINGSPILANAGVYSTTVSLRTGDNVVKLRASDKSGNISTDSIVITRGEPMAISMSCGYNHTIALLEDGRIVSWGDSSKLQNRAPAPSLSYAKVVARGNVSAVLTKDGRVVVWGDTANGTSAIMQSPDQFVDIALVWNNFIVGLTWKGVIKVFGLYDPEDGVKEFYASYPNLTDRIVKIDGGYRHAIALTETGKVLVWGFQEDGQGSIPKDLPKIKDVAAGTLQTMAIDSSGKVYSWGGDHTPLFDVPSDLGEAQAIAAFSASAAAMKDGSVKVWATANNVLIPPSHVSNVVKVSIGNEHACGVRQNGSVVCWGNGSSARLNVPFELRK